MGRISLVHDKLEALGICIDVLIENSLTNLRVPTPNAWSHIRESDIKAFSIQNMMGLIRWCADFLVFVCQELLQGIFGSGFLCGQSVSILIQQVLRIRS